MAARLITATPSAASTVWPAVRPIFTLSAGTTLLAATPATATGMTNRDKTGFDTNDPLFRRLVAGIFFSRGFVATYYYLVAFTLILFAASHWYTRFRRRQRALQNDVDTATDALVFKQLLASYRHQHRSYGLNSDDAYDETARAISSGSSSSTLCDYESTCYDEHSPLMKNHGHLKSQNGHSRFRNLVRSWLAAQPAPLPFFSGRTMPANSTTAFLVLYFLINLFYLLYNIEFSVDMLFVLADRAAVLFVTNLPVLYLLSAKNQPLQPLIGYSHASLNICHRRLGEWMSFLGLTHGGLMFVVWAVTLRPKEYTFARFITDRVTILGLCALACYKLIYLTSLSEVRKRAYEVFLAFHVSLQVGALAFLYFHHSQSRTYVVVSVTIWALDRIWCRAIARSCNSEATLEIMADGSTVRLNVDVPLRLPNWFRALFGLKTIFQGWDAMDHVFLKIPALGKGHMFQSHPFTIATEAARPDQCKATLGLIIRAKNGFTSDLLEYARQHKTVSVQIDGPYGSQSASRLLRSSNVRILIAGGSGIAVTWPLVHSLLEASNLRPSDEESCRPPLLRQQTYFIWIVHSMQQYKWIDSSLLAALNEKFGITVLLPSPTELGDRPAISKILHDCVESSSLNNKIAVVCSGPDAMTRDVRNGCSDLMTLGKDIEVEIEKYGW